MYFSGQHGRLQIADPNTGVLNEVGRLKNWSYSTQQQTLDTTCLSDVDKTLINGVRSTTGQESLLYYEEAVSNVDLIGRYLVKTGRDVAPEGDDYGSTAAKPALCLIKLALPGGVGGGPNQRTTAMYAHITSFSMTCSVGEVVSADISWECTGAPTIWDYNS